MTEDLDGISFDDENLETCKRYCHKGYVVTERIPYVCGFELWVTWGKWWKSFYFKYKPYNILWLHFKVDKVKRHKCGKIVYTPNE